MKNLITLVKKLLPYIKRYAIILIFLMIIIIASCLSPLFLKLNNLKNIGFQAAPLGILSIGQTIVLLTAGIDLSVDTVMTSTVVFAAGFMQGEPTRLIPSIFLVLVMGIIIGLLNGNIITKFNVPDFVTTLGMRNIVIGLYMLYCGTREVGLASPFLMKIGSSTLGILPIPFLIFITIAIFVSFFLRSTTTGRGIYAVGGNADGAIVVGINIKRIKITAYALSGILSSFAGLILVARMGVGYPQAGEGFLLDSVAASVIGGTSLFGGRGKVWGTVIGALILAILNNLFNLLGISPFLQIIFKGIIVISSVSIWSNVQID